MKHLLLTSALLCAGISFSQVTLTATDVDPQIGDEFEYTIVDYVQPGPSGANQTWDFSGLNLTSSSSIMTYGPSNSSYPSANFSADVVTPLGQGNNQTHMELNPTQWFIHAIISPQTQVVFSDAQLGLFFPLSLNATQTDDFVASINQAGQMMNRVGETTITVDGTGTLILPNQTYTDVVRVHLYTENEDEFMGQTVQSYTESYAFYVAGTGSYLLQLNEVSAFGQSQYAAMLLTDQSVATDNEDALADLNVYPNPFNTEIKLSGLNNELSKVNITDLSGKVVKSISLNAASDALIISTEELQNGMYVLNLFGREGELLKTEKIIKN